MGTITQAAKHGHLRILGKNGVDLGQAAQDVYRSSRALDDLHIGTHGAQASGIYVLIHAYSD